jgi:hypothetical protein
MAPDYTRLEPQSRKFSKGHKMLTEELYTVREASELPWLRLKYWTLWDLMKKGHLTRTKVHGKTLIRRSELEKLIVDVPKPKASQRGKR